MAASRRIGISILNSPSRGKTSIWVSRLSICIPAHACAEYVAPHLDLVPQAANHVGPLPVIRNHSRNRLAVLGDDQPIVVEPVQQRQALLFELRGASIVSISLSPHRIATWYEQSPRASILADRRLSGRSSRRRSPMQFSCQVRSYFIPNCSDTGLPATGDAFIPPFMLVMREVGQSRMMSSIVIPKDGRAIVKHVVERIRLQQRRATREYHSQLYMQAATWEFYCSPQSCVCFASG